ncbi:RNA polymerase sigma factor [Euzebya tangerina]|uniref:RNA polymerase sigma factor n=1 Tax=Euzebya tangerina TaxID=591198 RepID=UPI000E312CEF|nr:sigma-70 family RNA polymerase sigma factor [Euzebya tangerina]
MTDTTNNADVQQFGRDLFDRYADRVHDLAFTLTRDAARAAEITLEVIVMTASQPERFRVEAASNHPDLLVWLYTQVRAEVFSALGTSARSPADERVISIPLMPGAATGADLAGVTWEAIRAFSERDQALLALSGRHALSGQQLAAVMGLSRAAVDVLLPSTLDRVRTQLTTLLLLCTGQVQGCDALSRVLWEWDGTFSPFVRRRAEELSATCPELWAGVPGPIELLRTIPPVPAPTALRLAIEERLEVVAAMGEGAGAGSASMPDETLPPRAGATPGAVRPAAAGPDLGETRSSDVAPRRTGAVVAAACGAAVLVALIGIVLGARGSSDRVAAVEPSVTVSEVPPPPIEPSGQDAAATASAGSGGSTPPLQPGGTASRAPDAGLRDALRGPGSATEISSDAETPIRITNAADRAVAWMIVQAPAWLALDRTEGTIEPGPPIEVGALIRDDVPEGDYEGTVVIEWQADGPQTLELAVRGSSERAPEIQDVAVSTNTLGVEGCAGEQATFSVVVGDESQLTQVVVASVGPAPDRQVQASLVPDENEVGRFVGPVGPFDQPGTVSTAVTALDVRGNETQLETGVLTVTDC